MFLIKRGLVHATWWLTKQVSSEQPQSLILHTIEMNSLECLVKATHCLQVNSPSWLSAQLIHLALMHPYYSQGLAAEPTVSAVCKVFVQTNKGAHLNRNIFWQWAPFNVNFIDSWWHSMLGFSYSHCRWLHCISPVAGSIQSDLA